MVDQQPTVVDSGGETERRKNIVGKIEAASLDRFIVSFPQLEF